MNKLNLKTGYYVYKDGANRMKCTPCVFPDKDQKLLEDINGYSLSDTKEFIRGLYNIMNGKRTWNGDDYDYHWSGGDIIKFISNDKSTIILDTFDEHSIEVCTLEIYQMLLNRLRLMEHYPIRFIKKMIVNTIMELKSKNYNTCCLHSEIHIEIKLSAEDQVFMEGNADLILFDEKYFPSTEEHEDFS